MIKLLAVMLTLMLGSFPAMAACSFEATQPDIILLDKDKNVVPDVSVSRSTLKLGSKASQSCPSDTCYGRYDGDIKLTYKCDDVVTPPTITCGEGTVFDAATSSCEVAPIITPPNPDVPCGDGFTGIEPDCVPIVVSESPYAEWNVVALENESFTLPSGEVHTVVYGLQDAWVTIADVQGGQAINCNSTFAGSDPIVGQGKECRSFKTGDVAPVVLTDADCAPQIAADDGSICINDETKVCEQGWVWNSVTDQCDEVLSNMDVNNSFCDDPSTAVCESTFGGLKLANFESEGCMFVKIDGENIAFYSGSESGGTCDNGPANLCTSEVATICGQGYAGHPSIAYNRDTTLVIKNDTMIIE